MNSQGIQVGAHRVGEISPHLDFVRGEGGPRNPRLVVPLEISLHPRPASEALAVTGRERDRLLPETPTLAESGLPNVHGEAWIGLAAPAKLSPATITKINDAVSRALRAPDLRKHYEDQGWQVVGGSSTDFASAIRADHAIWGRIIRESGLKLN